MKREQPKITIIIPTLGNKLLLKNCLESLKKNSYKNFEVIILDNSSNLKKEDFSEFNLNILLIKSDNRKGFAESINTGIKQGIINKSNYFFALNDDTTIEKDCIKKIIDIMEKDSNIGICGVSILEGENKAVIQSQGEKFYSLFGITRHINQNKKYEESKKISEPDFVSGCAMMIKKEVIKEIGLFDTVFLFYYEDLDFCLRAKEKFKIIIKNDSVIWHYGSKTSKKFSLKAYHKIRSFLIFIRKNIPIKLWPSYFLSFMFIYLPLNFLQNFNFSFKYLKSIFNGIKNGLFDEIKK